MGELIHLPVKGELTPEQREYWEYQLEVAKRMAEYALRMLEGKYEVEKEDSRTEE